MMLDPNFKIMLEEQAAATQDVPPLETIPPEVIRAGYQALRVSQNTRTSPVEVETRELLVDGASEKTPARLYIPDEAETPGPCLVYFHGGGFVIGDLETHDAHCRRLSVWSAVRLLAVDYRLAPEWPFPASHDDALAATRWVFDHAAEIDVDPTRIGIGGDSAGGNLAASVAIDFREDAERNLKFQLLLYPALWPEEETASRQERDGPVLTKAAIAFFEKALGAMDHPEGLRAAPAQVRDLSCLPPAFIATAGFDPLEHEGRDYAAALQMAGVEARHVNYPTLIHDFYVMGDVSPAVIGAAREAAEAIREAL
ncbi:MAG TPA: alpha/beta hydrolase [Caulobacteraceae bacterium]